MNNPPSPRIPLTLLGLKANLTLPKPPEIHRPDSEPASPDETRHDDDAVIGRAFRISIVVIVLLAVIGGGLAWYLTRRDETVADQQEQVTLPQNRNVSAVTLPHIPFTDITQNAGLNFIHENGATGEKLLPETMGAGCAFLDYDNDGDQDIFLVDSQRWPWDEQPETEQPTARLYENDGQGNFTDVTEEKGIDVAAYGMGVAAADYDNDGLIDLFISAVGSNRLLKNEDGVFTDVTDQLGVAGDADRWSTSACWFDFDNDGDLDLFVCNYVTWSRDIDLAQNFQLTGIGRAYGPPTAFEGAQPYLYRNDGDIFRDVSTTSGVQQVNVNTGVALAKSLGVIPVDLDEDGWLDLVVANDTVRNLLFRNQADGTFEEIAINSGMAFDAQGKARGAMGIDVAHFRNDECIGIAIANFANEMTGLYVCEDNSLLFTDDAIPTGLGPPTRMDLSFGLCFLDIDLDGRLDLLAANGHLESEINTVQSSQHYQQPTRLFWNAGLEGQTEFVAMNREQLGDDFETPLVGRGASYGDIDGDGDLDVLLTQNGGPPLLLRNDQQLEHNFLRFKLTGTQSNRDAIGAKVIVQLSPDQKLTRMVIPAGSYLSQKEFPVTIGLGTETNIESVTVIWPDGTAQAVNDWNLNSVTTVTQDAKP